MRTDVISMTKGSLTGALELLSPTQPGRLAGSCYLVLDKPKQAQPILGSDGGELRDRSKSQALVLGNLSLARIWQGKVNDAVAMLPGSPSEWRRRRPRGGRPPHCVAR
jgi:hypothetical protein